MVTMGQKVLCNALTSLSLSACNGSKVPHTVHFIGIFFARDDRRADYVIEHLCARRTVRLFAFDIRYDRPDIVLEVLPANTNRQL